MKFCPECGASVVKKVPAGDNRERLVCEACGFIHYQNPIIIASCLAHWEDKIVWMKRADEPRKGYWVIPAGYMEKGESLREAAARELQEETGAVVIPENMQLHALGNLMYTDEVYIIFRAPLETPALNAGVESEDVGLFSEADAPWSNLAYPITENYVRRFYHELQSGQFTAYIGEFRDTGNWTQDIATELS